MNIHFENPYFDDLYNNYLKKQKEMCNEDTLHDCLVTKNKLDSLANKYSDNCYKLFQSAYSKIVRKEYAVKGEYLPRGFYCPSQVRDIIVGNCVRGKILKKFTSKSHPTFEYGFVADNRLVAVRYLFLFGNYYELLLYNQNSVVGIVFSVDENEITNIYSVNESKFDNSNRIKVFSECNEFYKNKSLEVSKEIYFYDKNGLNKVEWCQLHYKNSKPTITREIYNFFHDSNGYLSEYTVVPRMFTDEKYKIYIKRKV